MKLPESEIVNRTRTQEWIDGGFEEEWYDEELKNCRGDLKLSWERCSYTYSENFGRARYFLSPTKEPLLPMQHPCR